jgi:hypothetical protein
LEHFCLLGCTQPVAEEEAGSFRVEQTACQKWGNGVKLLSLFFKDCEMVKENDWAACMFARYLPWSDANPTEFAADSLRFCPIANPANSNHGVKAPISQLPHAVFNAKLT